MASDVDRTIWKGRDDNAECGDVRRLFQVVRVGDATTPAGSAALIGFSCDAGVVRNQGRPGAAQGPNAIRRMLAGLPAHHINALWDFGDVICTDGALESAQLELGERIAMLLQRKIHPYVLGGGHEVAWGSYLGLKSWLQSQESKSTCRKLMILNLDAHFDLRASRPANSGTPFDQIARDCVSEQRPFLYACWGVSRLANTPALYARGKELGADVIEDVDMQERHIDRILVRLQRLLCDVDDVYFTIDLDALPASVVPGVSAPAACGIPLAMVEAIAACLQESGKLRLCDIAELNPTFDRDGQSARVAARLVWRGLGVASQP